MATLRWNPGQVPPPPDEGLMARLAALPVANVGDAMGGLGVMAPRIRHVGGPPRLCAPALTVEAPPADNLALHRALAMPEAEGRVIVLGAAEGAPAGLFGELMLGEAVARGVAGLVLDAHVRDLEALREGPLPVFAAGVHPRKAAKAGEGRVAWPVACGGVAVSPGDVVLADADGIAVVPLGRLAEVVEAAEEVAERERATRAATAAGRPLAEVLGLMPLEP
jgi:regulator of RNase E activity RraA